MVCARTRTNLDRGRPVVIGFYEMPNVRRATGFCVRNDTGSMGIRIYVVDGQPTRTTDFDPTKTTPKLKYSSSSLVLRFTKSLSCCTTTLPRFSNTLFPIRCAKSVPLPLLLSSSAVFSGLSDGLFPFGSQSIVAFNLSALVLRPYHHRLPFNSLAYYEVCNPRLPLCFLYPFICLRVSV